MGTKCSRCIFKKQSFEPKCGSGTNRVFKKVDLLAAPSCLLYVTAAVDLLEAPSCLLYVTAACL